MDKILQALSNNGFATIDYLVFIAYIIILVSLGIFLSRGKKGEEKSSTDYFLAGNTLTWWAVGASLIAANISAEQFIGMSGSAFNSGIAMAAYELMAAATLIIVGKFLLPLMIEKKVFTIPQFLRDRYNEGVGLSFSIFWLFLYVFINLTSVAWLGALAIQQILGLPTDMYMNLGGMQVDAVRMTIILILFLIAGLYSIYGGLASVAWTDVMQVTFLVGGGLITAYAALSVIGSELNIDGGAFGAFSEIYSHLASIPGDKHFNLVVTRNMEMYENIYDDPYFDIPGIVVVVGALWLTNLGYWGFNQYIIQKGLAAKSLDEAKKGMIFAAFYIMNGTYNGQPVFDQLTLYGSIERSDDAYPYLIRNFTPVFVKGLSFAALAAAVISSLASMFNSTSTIFTMDIYKHYIDRGASEKKLVNVGRITSLCALIMALIAVYPIMGGADQAFQVIQEYSGFVYPGIVVIFGLGLLWKRASGTAAVVAAIGTFAFSIFFKFALPDVPFLLRMGYVFICLVILFFGISLSSKNTKPAEVLSEKTKRTLFKWSHVALGAAVTCVVLGCLTFYIKECQLLGFEAFFFLAAMMFSIYLYLYNNAKDTVEDVKSIGVDVAIFKTNTAFNLGAAGVVIILVILYGILW